MVVDPNTSIGGTQLLIGLSSSRKNDATFRTGVEQSLLASGHGYYQHTSHQREGISRERYRHRNLQHREASLESRSPCLAAASAKPCNLVMTRGDASLLRTTAVRYACGGVRKRTFRKDDPPPAWRHGSHTHRYEPHGQVAARASYER